MMLLQLIVSMMMQASPAVSTHRADDDVVVLANKKGFKVGLRVLQAAQAAFLANRNQYAPTSTLFFLVERRNGLSDQAPLKIDVTDGTREIPILLASDGSFQLPAVPNGKWRVESNASRDQMKISAFVLSPQATRYDYRLGDARLQCHANWAMMKAEASILAAPVIGMVDAAGSCSSAKLRIAAVAPRPIRAVTIEEGSRTSSIEVNRGQQFYTPPVSDRTFSNDARIKIIPD